MIETGRRVLIIAKETILRKSEYQQKVLKFKKTSPFSQNFPFNIFIQKIYKKIYMKYSVKMQFQNILHFKSNNQAIVVEI